MSKQNSIFIALWLAAVGGVWFAMLSYQRTPGKSAQAAQLRPCGSALKFHPGQSMLVMFAHPRCPCTSASLEELKAIVASLKPVAEPVNSSAHCVAAESQEQRCSSTDGAASGSQAGTSSLDVVVVFFVPRGASREWTDADLIRRAESIAGVRVLKDPDGREAELFKATTSGEVRFYDRGGFLTFRGGITPQRGHRGDNPGAAAVRRLAAGLPVSGPAVPLTGPVFGCSILADPAEPPPKLTDSTHPAVDRCNKTSRRI